MCGSTPPLLPAARRRGGIRPGRGDVAEAVTAAVARSGTPAPAKGAFTAEKSPLLPAGWLSVAGVILRLGHSRCAHLESMARVELGLCSANGVRTNGSTEYAFELVKPHAPGLLGRVVLHQFALRYSAARQLHLALAQSDGVAGRLGLSLEFPPPNHTRNMTTTGNRSARASALLRYFRQLLLTHEAVWDDSGLCAALRCDRATATVLWVAVRQSQVLSHPEPEPEPEFSFERLAVPPAEHPAEPGSPLGGAIPGRFRGWWMNDQRRSEDWEPMLKALGLGWFLRKVGRGLNPDVEVWARCLSRCVCQRSYWLRRACCPALLHGHAFQRLRFDHAGGQYRQLPSERGRGG